MKTLTGRLTKDGDDWVLEKTLFTLDARANSWVYKNMMKFMLEHKIVICKVNEDNVLLSVRAK